MKLEELSVVELDKKIEELKVQKRECEIKVTENYLDKIKLIANILGDVFKAQYLYREPKNFWERRKVKRTRYNPKRFLTRRTLLFQGNWYLGEKHASLLDVGFSYHPQMPPVKETRGRSEYESGWSAGLIQNFGVCYDKIPVLEVRKVLRPFETSEGPGEENITLSAFKGDVEGWIDELDELYLIAFETKRLSRVEETRKLTASIQKLCPYMKVEKIED
jgi:hypothetical protein